MVRIKKIEDSGFKSASRGNYYRAVVKLIEFIKDSPAVAFGVKGFQLPNDQHMSLSRSVEAWEKRTKITSKLAKREAIQRNNQDDYIENDQWASVAEVFGATKRVCQFLNKMSQQSSPLTETEQNQYVNMLYTALNAFRGGRAGAIAGMYV